MENLSKNEIIIVDQENSYFLVKGSENEKRKMIKRGIISNLPAVLTYFKKNKRKKIEVPAPSDV